MERINKKNIMIIVFVVIFTFAIMNLLEESIFATNETENEVEQSDNYELLSLDNVEGFKNYLTSVNIDIYQIEDAKYLMNNFDYLYNDALSNNYIYEVDNDILLYRDSIANSIYLEDENGVIINPSPRWTSGKTLDEANNGTHQVITRDAINFIDSTFPNFFIKDDNIYVTQLYSDYPDIYEKHDVYSWHFYNYITKGNYWDNILDSINAKTKFFEHYNKAIAYYYTNRIQSFRELGCAMHYLSDIATPVHTGDGIESSEYWVSVLNSNNGLATAVGILLAMYMNHSSFENYVNDRDENSECNIPSSIDFDYYMTTSLDTIIEDLAEYSYGYYDEAIGNDANKNIAMINTVPRAKEAVAGVLYRFAQMFYNTSDYNGFLFRNVASNLYITIANSNYANQTNVELGALSLNANQVFNYDKYTYSDSLSACNVIKPIDNNLKALDVSGGSSNNGANIQIYDKNETYAQMFSINTIMSSDTIPSYTGVYTISTCVTDYDKVFSCQNDGTTVGTNIHQWENSSSQTKQWYIDAYKEISVNWYSPNTQSNYITKGQRVYYKLSITTPGVYVMQTYSEKDTFMQLYSNTMQLLNSNDDGGENYNSKISYTLSAGTYYLLVRMYHSQVEGRINTVIAKTSDIPQTAYSNFNQQVSLSAYEVRYYKISSEQSNNISNIYTTGNYDTFIGIYDNNFNCIGTNDDGGLNNNAYYTYNFSGNKPIFALVRMYNGANAGTFNFIVDHPHIHSYTDSYVWYTYTQHRSICECEEYILQPHVVSANSYGSGMQTYYCMLCGGQSSIGPIEPYGNNLYPFTANGSFILPNGVIVLVDDDIEAYLDGTLIFNYPNIN